LSNTGILFVFFSSRRRHTRFSRDWSSDVCSSDLGSRTSPPPAQFEYAEDVAGASAAVAGEDAATISLRMGNGRPAWTWDDGSGTWLRSESGADAVSMDGTRLSAVNVVILSVEARSSGFRAQGGASVPTLRLAGERGRAYVATGGKIVEGRWAKEAE